MKWLQTAWPLHCSAAVPLPSVLCGNCWQEDLSPKYTPVGFVVSLWSSCILPWICSWWWYLLSADSDGDKLTAFHSGRGDRRISGGWREAPSSTRLQGICLLFGCMGLLHFSRANTVSPGPISLWAFLEWDKLGRFHFENVLWWKCNMCAYHSNF